MGYGTFNLLWWWWYCYVSIWQSPESFRPAISYITTQPISLIPSLFQRHCSAWRSTLTARGAVVEFPLMVPSRLDDSSYGLHLSIGIRFTCARQSSWFGLLRALQVKDVMMYAEALSCNANHLWFVWVSMASEVLFYSVCSHISSVPVFTSRLCLQWV